MLGLKEVSPTERILFVILKTSLGFIFNMLYLLLFSVCFELIVHRSYDPVEPMF